VGLLILQLSWLTRRDATHRQDTAAQSIALQALFLHARVTHCARCVMGHDARIDTHQMGYAKIASFHRAMGHMGHVFVFFN